MNRWPIYKWISTYTSIQGGVTYLCPPTVMFGQVCHPSSIYRCSDRADIPTDSLLGLSPMNPYDLDPIVLYSCLGYKWFGSVMHDELSCARPMCMCHNPMSSFDNRQSFIGQILSHAMWLWPMPDSNCNTSLKERIFSCSPWKTFKDEEIETSSAIHKSWGSQKGIFRVGISRFPLPIGEMANTPYDLTKCAGD